ncbi:MAG: GNAT family N-acetyltransferase [Beijerinckiaceae bacterium]
MFPDLFRDDVFRIETPRLWMRWPRSADARVLARMGGDPQVAEMTASLPLAYSEQNASEWIFASRRSNAGGDSAVLTLVRKREPRDALGVISLHATRPGAATLGFWLGRDHQGQGLMSEAAGALIDLALRMAPLEEIHARILAGDAPSRRVLEKCGFAALGSALADLPARGGVTPCERFRLARPPRSTENAA